jgi:VanZ family protein
MNGRARDPRVAGNPFALAPPARLRLSGWLALGWALLVVYGSLLPFNYQPIALEAAIEQFRHLPLLKLGVEQRADLLANFLLYLPVTFTLAAAWPGRRFGTASSVVVIAFGCILAAVVEFTQAWFPNRTASLNDLLAELAGSVGGVALYRLASTPVGRWVRALSRPESAPVIDAALALYALAWLALALFPLDFVMNAAELDWRLSMQTGFWVQADAASSPFRLLVGLMVELLAATPLGALLARRAGLAAAPGRAFLLAVLLSAAIETLQLLMASGVAQGVSAAARASGLVAGAALASNSLAGWADRLRAWRNPARSAWLGMLVYLPLAVVAVSAGKGAWEGLADAANRLHSLAWLPFYYHYYTSEPVALRSLIGTLALYAPIGALVALARLGRLRLKDAPRASGAPALLSGLAAGVLLEGLELGFQLARPDPTTLLVAPVGAWMGFRASAWVVQTVLEMHPQHGRGALVTRAALGGWALAFVAPLVAVAAVLDVQWQRLEAEEATATPIAGSLPRPASLAPVELPDFRYEHPRLPAPDPADLPFLDRDWIAQQRGLAEKGSLDALILMARLEPGRWSIGALLEKLLALKPVWRGHEQAKPLALAYDWLHEQWTPPERERLLEAALAACEHTADAIRGEDLSPYNVYLYNSPLQGLLACSIALYREDARANALLNFSHHLLTARVRPVWEQVMSDGGWHEGREYVGLGIGQAVWQLPALWRRATGEDWFRELPGLRGFLDFLIFRTRPDGTHMRLGDGNATRKAIPDRAALALEYRHAAGYSFHGCAREGRPTTWPWGPLADPALCQPQAHMALPPFRAFRGVGLLVSRTDWSPEATYVTFKAGDNFWSHQHLDAGAFTIYRGGALAIDSGSYGRHYGAAHHMNYHYQSIAHNVVTITDPDDTVPMPLPGAQAPRPVANDGGQRRVGSGWNLGRAPLDRAEWEAARDTYHTGRWVAEHESPELSIVVADLTPAYTNRWSGLGRFAERTRRVERYTRTFVHDRAADVILVRDSLSLYREGFTTRWLLHSQNEPHATATGFDIQVAAGEGRGRGGGRLEAVVMGPHAVEQRLVGGAGQEYLIDGLNYDDDGAIAKYLDSRPIEEREAGAWRVELVAPAGRRAEFLVALLPSDGTRPVPPIVTRMEDENGRYGCQWEGGGRALRWWFTPLADLPVVEQRGPDGEWRPVSLSLNAPVADDLSTPANDPAPVAGATAP